jgi:hypothetical protein
MISSSLIARKNEIEDELKRMERTRSTDKRRKQYLQARLQVICRDIARMGYSDDEIKTNEVKSGSESDKNKVVSKQFFVPPPDWVGK